LVREGGATYGDQRQTVTSARWPQVPTEKEIEAEARKQCLRAFEPYTYGPYFDALRDECRRKAREILEARERTEDYAVISQLGSNNKS
jgi:hypothetical protein